MGTGKREGSIVRLGSEDVWQEIKRITAREAERGVLRSESL